MAGSCLVAGFMLGKQFRHQEAKAYLFPLACKGKSKSYLALFYRGKAKSTFLFLIFSLFS